MRISSEEIGRAVAAVESGAGDSKHVATLVGEFMRRQPMVGHFVVAQSNELSPEGVVVILLHSSVVERCCQSVTGRRLQPLSALDLDRAAGRPDPQKYLAEEEPEVAAYLEGNVTAEDPTLGGPRRAVALSTLRTIVLALVAGI